MSASPSLPELFELPVVRLDRSQPAPFGVALRCPDCRDELTFTPTPTQPFREGGFGLLACSCSTFPVLDGIPVVRHGRVDEHDHMTGRAEVDGPSTAELVALLGEDRALDALVEMLAFPPPVPFGLGDRPGLRLPFTRGPWPRVARAARRGEVRAMLTDLDAHTAQDWMELSYLRSSERITAELFTYFFARFGQPRFLATMSLLQALPEDPRPVLDLACGFGHVMFHLSVRHRPAHVVGVDRNFFQLWVGRRYVAPGNTFVCTDRIDSLPFGDDTFSASLCGDAFHLFDAQQQALDELRRVAHSDTVILDRVGNAHLEPRDTDEERDPAGYVELLRGAPWRMVSEAELIAGYLAGFGPQLELEREPEELSGHKWLSIVTSQDTSVFVDHQQLEGDRPPHAAGTLGLNPIFTAREQDGQVLLSFAFPSTWYAFENAAMLSYTSAGERLTRSEFAALARGRAAGTDDLLARFVVLGMPPRYARAPGLRAATTTVAAGLAGGVRHLLARQRR